MTLTSCAGTRTRSWSVRNGEAGRSRAHGQDRAGTESANRCGSCSAGLQPGSRVLPALEMSGEPTEVLDELGGRGVLQLLVEGGATLLQNSTVHRLSTGMSFISHRLCSVETMRGPCSPGPGAPTIEQLWRGRIVSVEQLGDDVRMELAPEGREQVRRVA